MLEGWIIIWMYMAMVEMAFLDPGGVALGKKKMYAVMMA